MSVFKARVASVAGKRCRILLPDLSERNALLRGRLFADDFSGVAVGDDVDAVESEGQWMVESVHPRRNEFVRQGLRKERQVLFANVDRVLILASLNQPRTKEAGIDRFLAAALCGGISPVLVLSKTDLDTHANRATELRELYASFELPVYAVSFITGSGAEELLSAISTGTTALVGNSGVGKSTLVNSLIPGLDLKTREISAWSGKGTHTTTAALLIPFSPQFVRESKDESSCLIDTPGMKSFAPYGITRENLIGLFPDLAEQAGQCRFTNCGHHQEPGCVVQESVRMGVVAASRLKSYHRLVSELVE